MKDLRAIICGGRDLDPNLAWHILDEWLPPEIDERFPRGSKIGVVMTGGATGADAEAAEWARREGLKVITYPAAWRKHGKSAGPRRNAKMLEEGKPDVVIALPGGRGTADMVSKARAAGVPVIEFR